MIITSPTIFRDRLGRWVVDVRLDGLVVVEVAEPLDDDAARALSSALHHAANASEVMRRPRRGNDGDDPY